MKMHSARLLTETNGEIPIKISTSEKTTLIECQEPVPFLEYITSGRWNAPVGPDTYLRGCVLPKEGALFSLCNQFGLVADEVVRLTEEEAKRLILDRLS